VREGHIHTVKLLIELGSDIDHADTKNQRPLYYSIQHDRYEMAKFLIDKGAVLNTGDKSGVTPAAYAKKLNRTEILDLLLESGAPVPTEPRRPLKDK